LPKSGKAGAKEVPKADEGMAMEEVGVSLPSECMVSAFPTELTDFVSKGEGCGV